MGARLYNPTTGLFSSVDPVPGGNTTAYAYPQDPINQFDLNGQWKWAKKALRWTKKHWRGVTQAAVFGGCIVLSAGLCMGAGIAAAAVTSLRRKNGRVSWSKRSFVRDSLIAVGGGLVGRSIAGSCRASAVARVPRAPRALQSDQRVHFRGAARNMALNGVVGTAFLGVSWVSGMRPWRR